MALSASAVYHLTVEQLRHNGVERGLDSNGKARFLRCRLAEQVKSESMERSVQQEVTQASDPTDLLRSAAGSITPNVSLVFQHGSEGGRASLLVELLRQEIPLSSGEPEEILRLFVRLGEVYDLGHADERQLITRFLPLVSGSLLNFFWVIASGRQQE